MNTAEKVKFGNYLLHERIGAGGMAEIFLASDPSRNDPRRALVIKRILPQLSEDEQFVRMFVEEARLCVSLQHENIVQVYDLGEIDAQYFIAMEYVHGRDLLKTLAACARKRIAFPTDLALHIVMQVLLGLDYAHNALRPDGEPLGLIHRDVSPSNVLLGFDGRVKLGDFGIAKASTREKTAAGILKGKFGYMAPEQVAGRSIDHRADVFAVGIILYELLTGHRLFAGKNDLSVLERVRDAVIDPPIRQYRPDIAPELESLVMRALAKSPGQRFQSTRELYDALETYTERKGVAISAKRLARFLQDLFLNEATQDQFAAKPVKKHPSEPVRTMNERLPLEIVSRSTDPQISQEGFDDEESTSGADEADRAPPKTKSTGLEIVDVATDHDEAFEDIEETVGVGMTDPALAESLASEARAIRTSAKENNETELDLEERKGTSPTPYGGVAVAAIPDDEEHTGEIEDPGFAGHTERLPSAEELAFLDEAEFEEAKSVSASPFGQGGTRESYEAERVEQTAASFELPNFDDEESDRTQDGGEPSRRPMTKVLTTAADHQLGDSEDSTAAEIIETPRGPAPAGLERRSASRSVEPRTALSVVNPPAAPSSRGPLIGRRASSGVTSALSEVLEIEAELAEIRSTSQIEEPEPDEFTRHGDLAGLLAPALPFSGGEEETAGEDAASSPRFADKEDTADRTTGAQSEAPSVKQPGRLGDAGADDLFGALDNLHTGHLDIARESSFDPGEEASLEATGVGRAFARGPTQALSPEIVEASLKAPSVHLGPMPQAVEGDESGISVRFEFEPEEPTHSIDESGLLENMPSAAPPKTGVDVPPSSSLANEATAYGPVVRGGSLPDDTNEDSAAEIGAHEEEGTENSDDSVPGMQFHDDRTPLAERTHAPSGAARISIAPLGRENSLLSGTFDLPEFAPSGVSAPQDPMRPSSDPPPSIRVNGRASVSPGPAARHSRPPPDIEERMRAIVERGRAVKEIKRSDPPSSPREKTPNPVVETTKTNYQALSDPPPEIAAGPKPPIHQLPRSPSPPAMGTPSAVPYPQVTAPSRTWRMSIAASMVAALVTLLVLVVFLVKEGFPGRLFSSAEEAPQTPKQIAPVTPPAPPPINPTPPIEPPPEKAAAPEKEPPSSPKAVLSSAPIRELEVDPPPPKAPEPPPKEEPAPSPAAKTEAPKETPPKPHPKPAPRPEPRAKPKPAPKSAARPEPKPEPRAKGSAKTGLRAECKKPVDLVIRGVGDFKGVTRKIIPLSAGVVQISVLRDGRRKNYTMRIVEGELVDLTCD